MKILIDASVCSKGGGVQVALALINNIAQDPTFDVICVTSPQVDIQLSPEIKAKISYYYAEVNENILGKRKQGKRLAEIENKHNPDLVFIVFGPSYWRPKSKSLQGFALPLMVYPETRDRVYKDSFVTYCYQKLLNFYKARLMKKNADYVAVETSAFKERVHHLLGIDNEHIFVVENSFNANFLEIETVNKKMDKLQIFVPTAYYPHKNLEILVDVAFELAKMQKTHLVFNFLLPETSAPWVNMKSKAKQLGVEEYFHTLGPVKNIQMAQLYAQTDFVLLPTVAEASTAVYPESFISRKVLLTSNVDFAVELCGDAAVYFDPYDAKDIAKKIVEIDSDPNKQQFLISMGLEQVEKSYLTPQQKWQKQRNLLLNLK